jgi:hypothetical protein
MSVDEVVAFLRAEDAQQVFLFRFADGTEIELTDPLVGPDDDGRRECIATVVRESPAAKVPAGSGLVFLLSEVADVRLSPRGFGYFR